jgi:hypothetical protein
VKLLRWIIEWLTFPLPQWPHPINLEDEDYIP